ncbi:MAG: electron transport complex subunit RsxC [Oscillospiraceae bacterium]|nr:electron transport complex subunit RsxC [Oscillospiraceae bacterium]
MSFAGVFPGGIHPKETEGGKAATSGQAVRTMPPPVRVVIPMQQHIGGPSQCTVQPGDLVNMGEVVGRAVGAWGVPVHASVSGRVVAVDRCVLLSGVSVPAVVIDNDFEDRWHEDCRPREDADSLPKEELLRIVRDAGIVGLGGATFPTAVKLAPPADKPVDTIILNGAECEPCLTADHRLMLEDPQAVADGLALAAKILGAKVAIVGIEDNKPDAVNAMRQAIQDRGKVVALPVRYPQGGERQLIYALTKRVVPVGKLPADVGAVVINVATVAAISHAVRQGKPLIDRIVTVTGRVAEPGNLRVRIGTALADVVDACGGLTEGADRVVLGGPMMGAAAPRLDLPLTKAMSGILALGKEGGARRESACIHCGRCAQACPMRLLPVKIDAASRQTMWDEAEGLQALACIECGCCTYVCPAKRELTQSCRTAKAGIHAQRAQKREKA